jgi:hypothetical protein
MSTFFATFGTQQKEANAKERRCNNWVFLLMGILVNARKIMKKK